MNEVVTRLVLAYRRELELYGDVLRLSREGSDRARACRPLAELHAVNERKRALLEEVEAIERTIALDKSNWREGARNSEGARELDRLLAQLTQCIGEILRAERETEQWIVAGSGISPLVPSMGV